MEEKKPISHVKAGLLIAAALVVFSIIVNFLGLTNTPGVNLLQYVIIIGGLILLVNQYGKANDHRVSFGNLFSYGFKATAVYTILFIVFTILFFLLFPDIKEKTFEMARVQLEEKGTFSDDEIDNAIGISRRFFWPGVVGGTMFIMIVIGAIGSLIGAAVTKKNPTNPFEQQQL